MASNLCKSEYLLRKAKVFYWREGDLILCYGFNRRVPVKIAKQIQLDKDTLLSKMPDMDQVFFLDNPCEWLGC
jgi:hypothetical protein